MAMRWAITSTASTAPLWVFAHRAIWLRLFPIRATYWVRSRSTSAAGTVQVRVRAIARRIGAESGTPAAFALARQSADSPGVRRTATRTGRRLAIGLRRHGGKGGGRPRPRNPPERGAVRVRRGGVPRQPLGYTQGMLALPP